MPEYYESQKIRSRDYTDRYRNCLLLKDKENFEVLLSTRKHLNIPESNLDTWHRVMVNETGRLDLIAYKYYNNALFWWVLAEANNIYDPLREILPGTLIRIPSIEALYGTNGALL